MDYLAQYLPVLMLGGIAIALCLLLIAVAYIRSTRAPSAAKEAPYECGFAPFEDTRHTFDVRFYLVAILFIIFDLEVMFLFPWAAALRAISWPGFGAMLVFLAILGVGFFYEWRKGALEWE